MERKNYSKEQKLQIIKESTEHGVTSTLEKHGIYAATYYSWKKKLDSMGEDGLNFRMTEPQLKRIRELEKENLELKQMLAESALTQRMRERLDQKKMILRKK